MKIISLFLIAVMQVHCSESSLQVQSLLANNEHALPPPQSSSKSDGTKYDEVTQTHNVELESTEATAETKTAIPVNVGGAFLTCQKMDAIHCRLDTADQQNMNVDNKFEVRFIVDETLVEFSKSSFAEWQWQLDPSIETAKLIILDLFFNMQVAYSYQTMISLKVMQIGDGTSQLQGCTPDYIENATIRAFYDEEVLLPPSTRSIVVNLQGLCGIVRSNDSLIQILNDDKTVIASAFLPITSDIINHFVRFENISSQEITLRVIPGDNKDIDDLFFGALSVSPLPYK